MDYKLIAPRQPDVSGLIQVLLNRGFNIAKIQKYLNTSDKDILDPLLLNNMKEGAQLLAKHIAAGTPTYLQVDSDCDGFTSSAILLNYLNAVFPDFAQNKITYSFHEGKEHGIDMSKAREYKFIICPDASSEEYEKHKILKEQGIDILIIDHHNAERVSDNACVINNQLCDYPTKSLSGAGMVYKFCKYLDQLLNKQYADNYCDLVALGCIADIMPLTDCELRQIIVKAMSNIYNPFIKAMIDKNAYQIKDNVTPHNLAFYVAPAINAIARIGEYSEKELLFQSMLDYKAYTLIDSTKRGHRGEQETVVEQAIRTCVNVRNKQSKTRDAFSEVLEKQIQEQQLLDNKILTILIENPQKETKNITGLIANKLMSKYKRPVLLLNKVVENEKIFWRGSGRNVAGCSIDSLQDFLKNTGLVEYANGHDNALGLSIADSDINNFIELTNTQLANENFDVSYPVDLIYDANFIDYNDLYSIAEADHLWGKDIEEPLIVIQKIILNQDNISLLKGTTLKITLNDGISLIKFGSSEEEFNQLMPQSLYATNTIEVVGTCQINSWDNKPQILIQDYNITTQNAYYF